LNKKTAKSQFLFEVNKKSEKGSSCGLGVRAFA